jgi:phosphoglycerate dehydrogenase-like enzyme
MNEVKKVIVTRDWCREKIFKQSVEREFNGIEFIVSGNRDEILKEVVNADVAFIGEFDEEILSAGTELKWIHALVGGAGSYLFPEMVDSPIPFTCSKPCYGLAGAEHAIGAMFIFSHRIHYIIGREPLAQGVGAEPIPRKGNDGRDAALIPNDLKGKTVGIIGMGNIGRALAVQASSLGMKVLGTARRTMENHKGLDKMYPPGKINELLANSDFVVIAVPLTEMTQGMVDDSILKHMKNTAYLIDCTGRPHVYNYNAIEQAIGEKRIAGVCFQPIPPTPEVDMPAADSAFWNRYNVFVTPCRGNSLEQEQLCLDLFFDNLKAFQAGESLNGLVDKEAGY